MFLLPHFVLDCFLWIDEYSPSLHQGVNSIMPDALNNLIWIAEHGNNLKTRERFFQRNF